MFLSLNLKLVFFLCGQYGSLDFLHLVFVVVHRRRRCNEVN